LHLQERTIVKSALLQVIQLITKSCPVMIDHSGKSGRLLLKMLLFLGTSLLNSLLGQD